MVVRCDTAVIENYLPDDYSDCEEGQVFHSSGIIVNSMHDDGTASVDNECNGSRKNFKRIQKFSIGSGFGPWRLEAICKRCTLC